MKPTDYLPTESWWATTDRAAFAQRQLTEQARMERSPMGQLKWMSLAESFRGPLAKMPRLPSTEESE
jgi:hypothetical protein